MTMRLPGFRRHLPLLVMLGIACAACGHVEVPGDAASGNYSAQYGVMAAPRAQCQAGDVAGQDGRWIDANGASTESNATRRVGASFPQPLAAKAMRVALNGDALRTLDRIDVQDADGAWRAVWQGTLDSALPHGCESVWLTRTLDGRPVAALRLSFRETATQVEVSNAQLPQGG
jgi:hypothetical protein